jgi:hypothetical protein
MAKNFSLFISALVAAFMAAGAANDLRDWRQAQAGAPAPECAVISLVRPVCR